MRVTLLESDRSFLHPAEWALVSTLAHGVLVGLALWTTAGGRQLPTDEREARVFFLLPPDRVDVRSRQTEIIQWGRLGGDLENGRHLTLPSEGRALVPTTYGARGRRDRSGARGDLPFGPQAAFVPDTVYSVLEVDDIVRYESSTAPIYPPELLAAGTQGMVHTTYVVDTLGQVDTTTITVLFSDDPRFTASVRTALGGMRFRPARRGGKPVRQLVEQRFKFLIAPASQAAANRRPEPS
jgi:TonB family protein